MTNREYITALLSNSAFVEYTSTELSSKDVAMMMALLKIDGKR